MRKAYLCQSKITVIFALLYPIIKFAICKFAEKMIDIKHWSWLFVYCGKFLLFCCGKQSFVCKGAILNTGVISTVYFLSHTTTDKGKAVIPRRFYCTSPVISFNCVSPPDHSSEMIDGFGALRADWILGISNVFNVCKVFCLLLHWSLNRLN